MNPIQKECIDRGITRICHFTQSRNMAHIFDEPYGIYSTQTLKANDMPHNPTDPNRYDGHDHLVCCSIEYPNTYYFFNVREHDPLFKDWVVLYIAPNLLWLPDTEFCPCNSARKCGLYVKSGVQGFHSLFQETSPGINFRRRSTHLYECPTDIQAEALLTDPIPLESIIGIAVKNGAQAQREIYRLRLQGITLTVPIYIVPKYFEKSAISPLIQNGYRIEETIYDGENYGR